MTPGSPSDTVEEEGEETAVCSQDLDGTWMAQAATADRRGVGLGGHRWRLQSSLTAAPGQCSRFLSAVGPVFPSGVPIHEEP